MSYNGTGTFSINSAGQPVVTGTTITSTAFNTLTADLATGLSTALCKDGQSTPTANIGLGAFKITNLGAGTLATDAARLSQIQSGAATFVVASGTDTILGTGSPALTAYATGNAFQFTVAGTNTGASTLNIDSLGAKAITRDGSTALVAGDLVSGSVVTVVYDGTRFQVLNSNSKTNFNLSGTLTAASTATATKFIPTGTSATGNGMYLPTTNALGFSTNGTEAMRIDASANVGIGTTSFGGRLGVDSGSAALVTNFNSTNASGGYVRFQNSGTAIGDVGSGANLFSGGTAGDFGLTSRSGNLVLGSNSTERMRIASAGNVLIGGTTQYGAAPLTVAGAGAYVSLSTSTTGYQLVRGFDGASERWAIGQIGFGGADGMAIYTGSANTERMRITASGNVGIGSTPAFSLGSGLEVERAGIATVRLENSSGSNGVEIAADSTTNGIRFYGLNNAPFVFSPNATEAMRIDTSGQLLVGKAASSQSVAGCELRPGSAYFAQTGIALYCNMISGTGTTVEFRQAASTVGAITVTASTTSYTSASDYRMKNVIGAVSDSGERIDALKPIEYEWKVDNSQARGFLAHEFQEVYPNSVSGTKDGTKEEEYEITPAVDATQDEEGVELTPAEPAVMGTRTVPDYQAMQASTSEVIADLVAELQSLRKRIATLESK